MNHHQMYIERVKEIDPTRFAQGLAQFGEKRDVLTIEDNKALYEILREIEVATMQESGIDEIAEMLSSQGDGNVRVPCRKCREVLVVEPKGKRGLCTDCARSIARDIYTGVMTAEDVLLGPAAPEDYVVFSCRCGSTLRKGEDPTGVYAQETSGPLVVTVCLSCSARRSVFV